MRHLSGRLIMIVDSSKPNQRRTFHFLSVTVPSHMGPGKYSWVVSLPDSASTECRLRISTGLYVHIKAEQVVI